jgi:hypothetical protein
VELNPDGQFHRHRLDLTSSPEYRGLIIGLAIEPFDQARPGEEIAIKSIVLPPAAGGESRKQSPR